MGLSFPTQFPLNFRGIANECIDELADYAGVKPQVAAITELEEFNIGHSIIARASLVGLERAVREMIEAAGADLRYLPPYSPDFNPIENAFAKLKALLRKASERTVNGLWAAIGRIIDLFPPAECANYFSAAGYDAI